MPANMSATLAATRERLAKRHSSIAPQPMNTSQPTTGRVTRASARLRVQHITEEAPAASSIEEEQQAPPPPVATEESITIPEEDPNEELDEIDD